MRWGLRIRTAAVACVLLPLLGWASPGASAAANGVAVLSSSSFVDSLGQVHIVGEVANRGASNVFDVEIGVDEKSASGSVIRSVPALASMSIMTPGDKSPFILTFQPPATYDHYSITGVHSTTTYQEPNHDFSVSGTHAYQGSDGLTHLAGSVTNHNGGEADWVQVLATEYDATGKVVNAEVTSPNNNSTSSLAAGESADWDVPLAGNSPMFLTTATIAQSSTPPAGPPPPSGQTPDVTSFRIPRLHIKTSECRQTYPAYATVTNPSSVNQIVSDIRRRSRVVTTMSLATPGSTTASGTIFFCPRDYGLGRFRAGPSTIYFEYDGGRHSVDDGTSATFLARQVAHANIDGTRHAASVTIRGRIRYFSVLKAAWRYLHNAQVTLQRYSGGVWQDVATRSTGDTGTAVFRVHSASIRKWRVVYSGSHTIWADRTAAVTR